mmetsp:Transcript_16830/g.43758  ORF Transcript_16830/g.43758 Transcript_16830/m.43758 type:complete len:391 (-) Transcript_16830:202-1374(-)
MPLGMALRKRAVAAAGVTMVTVVVLGLMVPHAQAYRSLGPTFGTAHKGCFTNGTSCTGWPMGQEIEVFSHTCADGTDGAGGVCVMNHFWSGGNWPGYQHSRLQYYVDGEKTASVNFPLGLGHGSSMLDDDAPWSAGAAFGKTGEPSGIFNTYAVPFQSIRVTVTLLSAPTAGTYAAALAELPAYHGRTTSFWIILRGHTILDTLPGGGVAVAGQGPPLQITLPGTGLAVPGTARLKTRENVAVPVDSGDYLEMVVSGPRGVGTGGTVFMVALEVETSGGPTFLEGCFRATDPGNHSTRFLLSSGTEDYFLGTYYFNRGKYQNPVAGLTRLDKSNGTSFSAYRLHGDDPLSWGGTGFRETWRNGDNEGCIESESRGAPAVVASSVAFYYEW